MTRTGHLCAEGRRLTGLLPRLINGGNTLPPDSILEEAPASCCLSRSHVSRGPFRERMGVTSHLGPLFPTQPPVNLSRVLKQSKCNFPPHLFCPRMGRQVD